MSDGVTETGIAYLRVSTDEQGSSGLGLKAQHAAIESACKQRGIEIGVSYEEIISGSVPADERPLLREALDALHRGASSGLIVAKLDRLSRSAFEFARLMRLSQIEGWSLACLDLGIDTRTPTGKMIATVMSAFAEFELDMIRVRTKAALAAKKGAGVKLGRPVAIPHEVELRICAERAAGHTWGAIAGALNNEGIPAGRGGRWYGSVVSQTWHRLHRGS